MSVKAINSTTDFHQTATTGHKGPLGAIMALFGAMNEGITLAGQYKDLTSRGVTPDVAVRKVFEQIKR